MGDTGAYFSPKIETMPSDEVRAMQQAKLEKQIRYIYQNSPFYQRKFAEAGLRPEHIKSIEDFRRLVPFTVKEELRKSQEDHPPLGDYVAAPLEMIIRVHSSTGTSGRPTYVGITKSDRASWTEIAARVMYAHGVRPGDTVIHATGLSFFVGGIPLTQGIEEIGATFVPIGTGASDRALSSLQDLQANTIHCTPSYSVYFTEYVKNQRGLDPRELGVKRFFGGGEPGYGWPSLKQRIEETWGAKAYEGYGCSEIVACTWGECEAQQGMHFLGSDYIFAEFVDPEDGMPIEIEDGMTAELVYSHLDRQANPLLRYRTRDLVTVWTQPCSCGRTSVRARCVGRNDDMLIVLGVNVFPSAIKEVVGGLRPRTTGEVQILLEQPGPKVDPPLRINVEHNVDRAEDLPDLKRQVEQALRDKLIFRADVELVPPGTLPRYETKAKLIRKLYEE